MENKFKEKELLNQSQTQLLIDKAVRKIGKEFNKEFERMRERILIFEIKYESKTKDK